MPAQRHANAAFMSSSLRENITVTKPGVHFRGGLLRKNLFTCILNSPGAVPLPRSPGEAVSRFRDDVNEITDSFLWFNDLIGYSLLSAIGIAIMLRIHAGITLAVFLPLVVVVVATKGIEERSLKLMSEVLAETMPEVAAERVVFLSGPSFAREVARGLPTDVVLAARDLQAARALQPLLHAPTFRTYASADPVGVQIGGAFKNVIAVATGACDGLEFGPNARAALITRGLAEITRLGVTLGANPLTFLGMAGVGDLILTCTGDQSRNRTLGKEVARGADPRVYLASQRAVAEGFYTAAAGYALAQKLGVEAPITENVYHVLHRDRPIAEAVTILMERTYRDELDGIEQPRAHG